MGTSVGFIEGLGVEALMAFSRGRAVASRMRNVKARRTLTPAA
jgi:hypothetical protein